MSALILAAGEGRRFDPSGRRFKLVELLPNGRSVICATCECYLDSVDEVVIVTGPNREAIRQAIFPYDLPLLQGVEQSEGMSGSIRCGVGATAPATGWLIALGDMPFVQTSTVQAVCRALKSGAMIARPFYQGRPGHPVGFSVALKDELLLVRGQDGARALIQRHATALLAIDVSDFGCVTDIDFQSDMPS
ncbi:MAG TPA: nucleotidyltransferase family protein [Castellaniella sp.]|uniref:nucleotidyltransferase family protein n=1 Tax=Castellaniella sp. TaxID=1955812 RepID=UPI002F14085B